MRCPSCSETLTMAAPACAVCGVPLEFVCNECGRASQVDAAFCAGCGARLETLRVAGLSARVGVDAPAQSRGLEGERRTVTVVMSDLSGYTALGERLDPEDVAQIMTEIKNDATQIVESFGGIVNQFVGDEVVSLFGLPNARGDDARRAVSAAFELHARVAELSERGTMAPTPLSMHSGIQTGLLIAEL